VTKGDDKTLQSHGARSKSKEQERCQVEHVGSPHFRCVVASARGLVLVQRNINSSFASLACCGEHCAMEMPFQMTHNSMCACISSGDFSRPCTTKKH
jgi:hypothetical protein